MAERTVTQSVANAGHKSLAWFLTLLTNQAATLANETKTQINRTLGAATNLITSPALAIGSDKPKVANGAFTYRINGVGYAKDAVAAGTAFTDTTHDIDPEKQRIFVLSINAGGDIAITPGAEADPGEAVAPATPANQAKMGEVSITTDDTVGGFDATTTELDAANLTVVYTNDTVDAAVATANMDTLTFRESGTPSL